MSLTVGEGSKYKKIFKRLSEKNIYSVDYIKAMIADKRGDIQVKEYYMREFWKKVGDNESNKRKVSMTYPVSPYAIR